MSSSCTPILVGVVSSVSKIWLPFKNGQISLRGMDYSPWSSKNSIDRNRLKKFMQVGIDVKFMHTDFDGCVFFGFGDMATFQKWPNFPFGAYSMVIEKFNRSESAQKFMQVGIDVKFMHIDFGGCGFFGFEDMATF